MLTLMQQILYVRKRSKSLLCINMKLVTTSRSKKDFLILKLKQRRREVILLQKQQQQRSKSRLQFGDVRLFLFLITDSESARKSCLLCPNNIPKPALFLALRNASLLDLHCLNKLMEGHPTLSACFILIPLKLNLHEATKIYF